MTRGPRHRALLHRRQATLAALAVLALPPLGLHAAEPAAALPSHPQRRWSDAAQAMRLRALAWGDQNYGAVLVMGDTLVGEGPSRVVKDGDPDAHAERVAIRDAQRRLGRSDLSGAVLYATSRPCALCEAAAARAGVARMFVGVEGVDAGRPGHP
jgi:tRNA(adenine34) deaminase